MKFLSLLAAALVAPLASALTIPEKRLTTPANDPFYVPPAGFESAKPGAVLRDRRIIASFFGIIPDPIEARQVLYRTTAIDGSAIATVTTIFKPLFAKSDRFIAFNTAYDSSASICNPSYGYQLGAPPLDLIAQAEFLIIQAYLLLGYTVASSDYEGPDVAFSAGRLSGMGVLDGMRAVVNYGSKIGLNSNPMIVNTGYSGGAIAGGWAASLHPTYAPDLNVKGFILGGTPANLTQVLLNVDGTLFAGFLPGAIAGLAMPSAYGAQLNPVLDQVITPHGRDVLALGSSQCVAVNIVAFAGQSLFDPKIQSMGRDLLYQKDVAAVLTDSTMGVKKTETPTVPVLLYHATGDEIIPYAGADTLRQSWCANGASVQFTTYAAGGHGTTEPIGLLDAIAFADNAFKGRVPSGCSTKSVLTNQLNPLALGLNLEPALSQLAGVILALGQKDANWKNAIQQGKTL
ncbi:Lipase, secreted [Cordyceps fumosorosea ARSEF 2679]|uniref:Lipase, secreted n=1 Tax=Cordyceps fumosorosea (strain ARSEF 2679) TaxID=1081104 RepID=A0A167SXC0_CORFA|nr:Lipase, secreted [Cordyceps fumosorosea ARSEF 2679]OAA60026.1 Lipase, secreted [Cordyceps fumosorosea ARSEF 2679]